MPTERELHRRALDVVSDAQLGMFMTCDEDGFPHGRWMHVLPMFGLQLLYSLTAGGSRKVDHIATHPEVSWLISSNYENVVLLKGRAEIHDSVAEIYELWDRLAAVAQQYAVGPMSDDENLQLVTIQTTVESVELICPALGLHVPTEIVLPRQET